MRSAARQWGVNFCRKTSNSVLALYVCDPGCPVQTPNRASGPKWEKNGRTMGSGPTRKKGENGRKMGNWPFSTHFWANFPIFRPFLSYRSRPDLDQYAQGVVHNTRALCYHVEDASYKARRAPHHFFCKTGQVLLEACS